MIDPKELEELFVDFMAEAEFEFEDEHDNMRWGVVNTEFLKWLAEENRVRAALAKNDKSGPGSFEHFRRIMSADA